MGQLERQLGKGDLFLPISRKDIIPKGKRDRSLFLVMIIMTPIIALFDLLCVMPLYQTVFMPFHIIIGCIFLMNIAVNMYRLMSTSASCRDLPPRALPPILLPNWFYCHQCMLNVPPRSYHCSICDECIMKQDHHCMFAGKCVGFQNQRFFVVGLTNIWLAILYSVSYHWSTIVNHYMGGFRWQLIFAQMAPHLGWLFGAFDVYGFLTGTLNLFEILAFLLSTKLMYHQVVGLFGNQTMYEQKHGVTKFRLRRLQDNIEEVLGERWILIWFMPWIDSPPKGDGINFAATALTSTVEVPQQTRKNR